jgi:ArsR family transcriptional regulator
MSARAKNGANAKFRAFSDETRLRILHLLQSGELCVGDIVAILRVPQPTASRHLSYLRKAKLVDTRKSGQWIHYALAPSRSVFHKKLLECLTNCFDEVEALKSDAERLKKLREKGGCCPRP